MSFDVKIKNSRWTVPSLFAILAAVLLFCGWRGVYRSLTPLPLRTAETNAFAAEVKAAVSVDRVSVRYNYPQRVEIQITGAELSLEEQQLVLAWITVLLNDPSFQQSYAVAYDARYAYAVDPSEGASSHKPASVMVVFKADGQLVPKKYNSQAPFESWEP